MTTRELRQILFAVDNQEMTVKELRALLFDVDEQDEEITDIDVFKITKKQSRAAKLCKTERKN